MDIYIPEDAMPKEQEKGFEPIEEGRYNASVYSAEHAEYQSGSTGVKVAFIINGGDFDKRQVFENFVNKDSCMWKMAQLLVATGYDISNGSVKGFQPADIVGKPVRIKVKNKPYGESVTSFVEYVDPPQGGASPATKTGFGVDL